MGSLDKSTGAEVFTVDVKATKGLLESGYTYLDVRTVEEYNKGHVDGEKIFNIPYMFNTPEGRVKNPNFLKEVSGVCKEEDKLLVGCQSGVRSLYATADLLSAVSSSKFIRQVSLPWFSFCFVPNFLNTH
ncbi:hypothetical protein H0E87_010371 [Populus deltoides]|uniref:Rhodanese domain-containing protein n=1 Tax=Populus deltoides TaxID=3696 RepID=A0A8T2YTD2_POPDE|nr:hypothetical protein H0E87_010371 [Populus deltoides]